MRCRRKREEEEAACICVGEMGRRRQRKRQRERQREGNRETEREREETVTELQGGDFREGGRNIQKVKEHECLEYLKLVSSSLLRYNKRFLIKGKHYPFLLRVGHLSFGG